MENGLRSLRSMWPKNMNSPIERREPTSECKWPLSGTSPFRGQLLFLRLPFVLEWNQVTLSLPATVLNMWQRIGSPKEITLIGYGSERDGNLRLCQKLTSRPRSDRSV